MDVTPLSPMAVGLKNGGLREITTDIIYPRNVLYHMEVFKDLNSPECVDRKRAQRALEQKLRPLKKRVVLYVDARHFHMEYMDWEEAFNLVKTIKQIHAVVVSVHCAAAAEEYPEGDIKYVGNMGRRSEAVNVSGVKAAACAAAGGGDAVDRAVRDQLRIIRGKASRTRISSWRTAFRKARATRATGTCRMLTGSRIIRQTSKICRSCAISRITRCLVS